MIIILYCIKYFLLFLLVLSASYKRCKHMRPHQFLKFYILQEFRRFILYKYIVLRFPHQTTEILQFTSLYHHVQSRKYSVFADKSIFPHIYNIKSKTINFNFIWKCLLRKDLTYRDTIFVQKTIVTLNV